MSVTGTDVVGIAQLGNDIRDALHDAGVRAVTDPRRVDPPCVLILPEEATFDHMTPGTGATTWVLRVLAPPPGNSDAFTQLSRLAARTIRVVPDIQAALVASYTTDGGDAWPCIELRFAAVSAWA